MQLCSPVTDLKHEGAEGRAINTTVRANESVSVWVTTRDRSKQLQAQTNVTFATDSGTNPTTITVP